MISLQMAYLIQEVFIISTGVIDYLNILRVVFAFLSKVSLILHYVDYNLYAGAEVCACNIYDNLHVFCTIICCYLAPGISNESFSNSIKCLHQLCLGGVRPLLLGDYNLPNINWVTGYFPSDFKYKVFFDFYSEFGFYQFIHESTRGSNVLDLLLTNDPLLLSSYYFDFPFCTSDHDSINCVIIIDKHCFSSHKNLSSDTFFAWKKLIGLPLLFFS